MELTARGRAMQEFTFQVFEAFAAATLIYFTVNMLVVLAAKETRGPARASSGSLVLTATQIPAGH